MKLLPFILAGTALAAGVAYLVRKREDGTSILDELTNKAPEWMEKGWRMFGKIEEHTRTNIAATALHDVTEKKPMQLNNMESFWLAETLKYFYLMFTDWDIVDLDKWVLNTEAHPLRIPE